MWYYTLGEDGGLKEVTYEEAVEIAEQGRPVLSSEFAMAGPEAVDCPGQEVEAEGR